MNAIIILPGQGLVLREHDFFEIFDILVPISRQTQKVVPNFWKCFLGNWRVPFDLQLEFFKILSNGIACGRCDNISGFQLRIYKML